MLSSLHTLIPTLLSLVSVILLKNVAPTLVFWLSFLYHNLYNNYLLHCNFKMFFVVIYLEFIREYHIPVVIMILVQNIILFITFFIIWYEYIPAIISAIEHALVFLTTFIV